MIGYYKIPLYDDSNELVTHICVPIIDYDKSINYGNQAQALRVTSGTTFNFNLPGVHEGYSSSALSKAIQYSRLGVVLPTSTSGEGNFTNYYLPNIEDDTNRLNSVNTALQDLINTSAGSYTLSLDKFNILSIARGRTETLHTSNGCDVQIVYSTESNNQILTISLKRGTQTYVTIKAVVGYSSSMSSSYGWHNFLVIADVATCKSYIDNNSGIEAYGYCCPYVCLCVFNRDLGNSYYGFMYRKAVRYNSINWSGDNIGRGRSFNVHGSGTNTGTLYYWLNVTNIESLDDVEKKENLPDDDKTYPGGGEDNNPYPDDDEQPSGEGDFDNTNDPIDFPILPGLDVQSTGFISVWKPTIGQLQDLYLWLWNSNGSYWEAFTSTLSKMFANPMEAIFSLGLIPVEPVTTGLRNVTIGHIDTGIQMESVLSQFTTFDFGSVDCTEYYGAAWDYSPYTKVSIYLPYIGVMDLDVDDVMNCTLTLRYNVDVVTGTIVALLKCKRKGRDNLDAIVYEWQGNCMTQCPITASDWSQKMASVLQLGAMTGLALMQPRAGQSTQNGEQNENPADIGRQLVSPSQYLNSALNVITSKVHVQRGGRLDLSAGAMSMQSAFLILNRPISAIPRGWNQYAGYPSLKIKRLGDMKGFTKVAAIKLNGLQATSEEIQELDTILKAGVIL